MKGDNNQSIDPTHPPINLVVGRAVAHIPHGGTWFHLLTSPAALALAAFALTIIGGTTVQTRRRRKRAAMCRHTPAHRGSFFALPASLRTGAGIVAVLAILGLMLAAIAWTTPPEKPTQTTSHATRQLTFSYTAIVANTAAYDGTTVHSPDPVFRRLTNTVDLHLAYQGTPGSVHVDLDLSAPSGWHTTLPLAAPTTLTGDGYESTVPLDLNALDARAQAAAAATGLTAAPLTVAVTATVANPGQAPFTPGVTFTLTPLQLSLVGDAKTLTVQDVTGTAHSSTVPRNLNLIGRHLAVTQVRAVSAAMLLTALLAAAGLLLILRRTEPADEGALIRRRYAPLLASVHPVAIAPNGRLIEVTEFATLAKLAERCGLLVLHWTRSTIDTYIVQDEGTTYRYRTGAPGTGIGTGDDASDALELDPAPLQPADAPISEAGIRPAEHIGPPTTNR